MRVEKLRKLQNYIFITVGVQYFKRCKNSLGGDMKQYNKCKKYASDRCPNRSLLKGIIPETLLRNMEITITRQMVERANAICSKCESFNEK